jgi:hypothetical protein
VLLTGIASATVAHDFLQPGPVFTATDNHCQMGTRRLTTAAKWALKKDLTDYRKPRMNTNDTNLNGHKKAQKAQRIEQEVTEVTEGGKRERL